MEIPTRLIIFKASGNPGRINEADFDAAIHADPDEKPASPGAGPAAPGVETPAEREARLKAKLAESNVAEVAEILASVTSNEDLDEIEAFEKAGRDRAGVRKAIAERRAELKG